MLKGLPERMQAEIMKVAPDGFDINVIAAAGKDKQAREFAVWRGCATIASTPAFANSMITKADFQELGARGAIAKMNP